MPAWKGCPGDLGAEWRKVWDVAHSDVSERGWRDAYHPTLERYVRALKTASDALVRYVAEPTSAGSKGQDVLSPHWKVYVEATRIADKSAADLLLTPATRAKVGDRPGGAKADDDPFP